MAVGLTSLFSFCCSKDTLSWLFEDLTANGEFAFVDGSAGNPNVGLTSAPCIAEGLSYDDDGQAEVEGRLWWFPQYETVALFEVLLERGEVLFQAAPGNEPTPRRPNKP